MTRAPQLLVLALALACAGCSGRKAPPEGASALPQAEPGAAGVGTAPAAEPRIYSGDLPLGEAPPDLGRFLATAAAQAGRAEAAAGAGEGFLAPEELELFGDILFAFDSYDLSPEARQQLTRLGAFLRDRPRLELLVEGHCDAQGDAAYNLALGEKRALTVREFLAGTKVSPARVFTVSFGEERPLDPGQGEEAWARNRRAAFRVRRR